MYKGQYLTIEWQNKKQDIIRKDNYTCQSCQKFNPSLGKVTIFDPIENNIEIHWYDSNNSVYFLTSQKHGILVRMDFHFGTWLRLPILQVHHKKYVENQKVWEYDDKDLTTYCKSCHTEFHKANPIEIVNPVLGKSYYKQYEPMDDDPQSQEFIPWTFVTGDKNHRKITSVYPFIGHFVLEKELGKIEETRKTVNEIVNHFFERFLPNYRTNKTTIA